MYINHDEIFSIKIYFFSIILIFDDNCMHLVVGSTDNQMISKEFGNPILTVFVSGTGLFSVFAKCQSRSQKERLDGFPTMG